MSDKILMDVMSNMTEAQDVITGGASKKEYVMNKLKENMTKEDYERYEPMISLTIDFIKYLSSNKHLLNALKNKKCFSLCNK